MWPYRRPSGATYQQKVHVNDFLKIAHCVCYAVRVCNIYIYIYILSNGRRAIGGEGVFWICFLYYWPTGLNRKFYGNFTQKDLPVLTPRHLPKPPRNPSNNPQKTRPDILGGTANRPGSKKTNRFYVSLIGF